MAKEIRVRDMQRVGQFEIDPCEMPLDLEPIQLTGVSNWLLTLSSSLMQADISCVYQGCGGVCWQESLGFDLFGGEEVLPNHQTGLMVMGPKEGAMIFKAYLVGQSSAESINTIQMEYVTFLYTNGWWHIVNSGLPFPVWGARDQKGIISLDLEVSDPYRLSGKLESWAREHIS